MYSEGIKEQGPSYFNGSSAPRQGVTFTWRRLVKIQPVEDWSEPLGALTRMMIS